MAAAIASREPAPEQAVLHRLALGPGIDVLALGASLRSTVCAAIGREALLTPALGDLDDPSVREAFLRAVRSMLERFGERGPAAIAHDLHPDFFSTRLARQIALETGARLVPVQHHHAHIEAIRAEHGLDGPVLGLALDGVGLGSDGSLWGGELLVVEDAGFRRVGHLRRLRQPGGDRAAREPWRMAASVLEALGQGDQIERRFAHQPGASGLAALLAAGTRSPLTSSLGRVFDAAAALLGVCELNRSDAEAPLALEALAREQGPVAALSRGWRIEADGTLDLLPLLAELADAGSGGRGPAWWSAVFHATLASALCDWLVRGASRLGLRTVVAAGGCMANAILERSLSLACREAGLDLRLASRLSPGDASIAFGQAAVARAALRASIALAATPDHHAVPIEVFN